MENGEFRILRKKLEKTQKQMSELLGTSLKAIQSFEQGWRRIPSHIERQLLFLISTKQGTPKGCPPCWKIRDCSPEIRQACPAWEFQAGHLCWFINGTICRGKGQQNWGSKMKVCRRCAVFAATMKG